MLHPETGAICWLTAKRPGINLTGVPVLVESQATGSKSFRVKSLDPKIGYIASTVRRWELTPMQPLEQLAWVDKAKELLD